MEEDAISNSTINLAGVAPCSHEEADTRIFVHARHAAEAGSKVIMVKANDTDILVIAISVLQALQNLGLQQLWVAFGQKQNLKWIPVHDLCCKLAEKSNGMLFFHALTGCDVVSGFRGKGKKSAWQTWNVCDEASGVFSKLIHYPPVVDDEDLEILEKFVVMMYDRSSTAEDVDEARLDMFARKQRPYKAIPPTRSALKQQSVLPSKHVQPHLINTFSCAGSVQPASGDSQQYVNQKHRLLKTGAGPRKVICGRLFGQSSNQLQRFASS